MILRPSSDGDTPFLLALYASTRDEERLRFGWSDETWQRFVAQQFTARQVSYREQYPGAEEYIVVVDGREVGRFMQCRLSDEMRLIDIALLPTHRSQGIGTALITALLESASERGLTVRLHVEKNNRAEHLYERLGFVVVADAGVHVLMERRPPAPVS